jgi:hypothetical protein
MATITQAGNKSKEQEFPVLVPKFARFLLIFDLFGGRWQFCIGL